MDNASKHQNLMPGARQLAELTVADAHLARQLEQTASDGFPGVFATMQMVGLMELAASRVLHPILEEGQMSVGVSVEINHSAPTPPGVKVIAEAVFTGMKGKLYVFNVLARDAGGIVGRGTHKRAIVDSLGLETLATQRNGA